jgi:hypothetical protein
VVVSLLFGEDRDGYRQVLRGGNNK